MRTRTRKRRDEEDTWQGRSLITLGVIGLLAIVGVGLWAQSTTRDLDKESGCPTDRLESVTAVLVDLTDPINGIQETALRNALLGIRDAVPKFGLLEIYPLTQTPTAVIQPLFSACSPGSGRDVDSRIYGNPELADRQWKQQFANKLDGIVESLKNQAPGDNSPILEGIQSIAVTAFGPSLRQKTPMKRAIIFSDMIHNMPGLNMYRAVPRSDNFIGTPYYAKTRSSLRGANVDVFLIVRDTQKEIQQPALYKFWVEVVQASDGYLKSWEPLQ
jgi:hypothetical protein